MASGDIYEVRDIQVLLGQHVENVFFYHQDLEFVTTHPNKAQTLAENWYAQICSPFIRKVQTPDVLHTAIKVRNLYDESDAYELAVSGAGYTAASGATGSITSPFDAFAFQLDGTNHAVKNGQKRFAGVDEGYVADGSVDPGSGAPTILADLATNLSAFVTVGLVIPDNVFSPVIVKRIRTGSAPPYTYSLPTNSGEADWSTIVVALFKLFITSQVSRKIGVGI